MAGSTTPALQNILPVDGKKLSLTPLQQDGVVDEGLFASIAASLNELASETTELAETLNIEEVESLPVSPTVVATAETAALHNQELLLPGVISTELAANPVDAQTPLNRILTAIQEQPAKALEANAAINSDRPALPTAVKPVPQANITAELPVTELSIDPGADSPLAPQINDKALKTLLTTQKDTPIAKADILSTEAKVNLAALTTNNTPTVSPTQSNTGVYKIELPGQIQQPAWQQALAERLVFAATKNISEAEIKLNPAELGPVNVRIEASQDKASLQISAALADTREALEAAMPRLREMFNQQGMHLVKADIQQQFSNAENPFQQAENTPANEPGNTAEQQEIEHPAASPAHHSNSTSLLDLYA